MSEIDSGTGLVAAEERDDATTAVLEREETQPAGEPAGTAAVPVLNALLAAALADAATAGTHGPARAADGAALASAAETGDADDPARTAVSPLAYLADLLHYATTHLLDGGAPVTAAGLAQTFFQPFDRFPVERSVMEAGVLQVRLCIEVLREYAGTLGSHGDAAALAEAEADYRMSAYTALLSRLGTSYRELRLAPAAGLGEIAERIGMTAAGLEALLLAPAEVTEAKLEELFGLRDTTREPFTEPAGEPVARASRRAFLREAWAREDRAAARPLLDPDLVRDEDLRSTAGDDPVFLLRKGRADDLAALAGRLDGIARDGARTETARYESMLAEVYDAARLARLAEAEQARAEGRPFAAAIEAIGLSATAFVRLMDVRDLAADDDAVLGAEWEDAAAILVQAWKRLQFGAWKDAEAAAELVLGPDRFRVAPQPEPTFPPRPVEPLPAWRATQADRRAWEELLGTRIERDRSVGEALAEAVSAVEQETLPPLRDALIAFAGPQGDAGDLEAQGKALTDRLLIDTRTFGRQATTRVAQAIETLQGVLFSVRTGQLYDTLPTLSLAAPAFDREWEWIGSYASWRAAMFVFLYPENVLVPSLRRSQTPGFRGLLSRLRSGRPTPDAARELARGYSEYLRDMCSLSVGARIEVPAGTRDRRTLELSFALVPAQGGAAPRAYWCARAPGSSGPEIVAFWDVVPALGRVVQLVGASVYRPPAGDRFVYLFVRVQEADGKEKLAFLRYGVDTGAWSGEPVAYDKIEDLRGVGAWVQATPESERPRVNIRPLQGSVYVRGLDARGTSWSEDALSGEGWKLFRAPAEQLPDSVVVVEGADGRLVAFASELRTQNNQPVRGAWWMAIEQRSGGFGAWQPIGVGGGVLRVIRYPDGRLHAFHLDVTGTMFHRLQTVAAGRMSSVPDGDWAPWEPLVGPNDLSNKDFTAVVNPQGRVELYAIDANNGISYNHQTATGWTRWVGMGDPSETDPLSLRAAVDANGGMMLFALGTDHTYWKNWRPAGANWQGWGRLGNPDDKGLTIEVEANADGRLEVFSVGTADDLWHNWQLAPGGAAWSGWARIGEESTKGYRIKPIRGGDGALHAFINTPINLLPFGVFGSGFVQHARQGVAGGEFGPWANRSITNLGARALAPFRRSNGRTGVVISAAPLPSIGILELEPLPGAYPAPDLVPVWTGSLEVTDRPEGGLGAQRIRTRQALESNHPAVHPYFEEAWYLAPVQVALELQRGGHYTAALDWLRTVYDYSRRDKVWHGLPIGDTSPEPYVRGDGWLSDPLDPYAVAAVRRNAHTRFVLQILAQSVLAYADAEFTRDNAESLPRARTLYLTALELVRKAVEARAPLPTETPVPTALRTPGAATLAELVEGHDAALAAAYSTLGAAPESGDGKLAIAGLHVAGTSSGPGWTPGLVALASSSFRIPPNPVLAALRLWASINLYKLRTGRNIAGIEREVDPYTAPVDAATGIPGIGLGGGIVVGGQRSTRPAPYRYAVLVDRARQLAGMAQQMEGAYLSAIERREAEAYTLTRARQDAVTASAGVRLGDLKVTAERGSVRLAELQLDRSQIQSDYFENLLDAGLNGWEISAVALQTAAVAASIAATTAGWIAAGFTAGLKSGDALKDLASSLQMSAGLASTLASFQRREQEWKFQLSLAQQDVRTGRQQLVIAGDRVKVAQQERVISDLQAQHASAVVEFLGNKFTSLELYEWMAGVLGDVYRSILQQAAAMAALAEGQLEFERQEVVPRVIQADYWEPAGTGGGSALAAPKRQGVTGSSRLLADLQTLDELAFSSDRRRLNLTRTVSLARHAPVEFQRFRDTGVMVFETSEGMFDQDFPGHYARQIRRVRTTVVALVPPAQGIRATLSTTRCSRVVVRQNGIFSTQQVPDGPASVALSSALDATGVFELDPQPAMRLPFEGMGVDAGWKLEMPRASNLFDYSTIADVLVTLEYTALESDDRRRQVLPTLPTRYEAMRAYSFRQQFADQWYDLHNHVGGGERMTVAFRTLRADFPANLSGLSLEGIALKVSVAEGESLSRVENLKVWLRHSGVAEPQLALVKGGIIDTGNAAAPWSGLLGAGREPVSEWEISFEDRPEVRAHFADEAITDLTFVLTFTATLPPRD